MEKSKIRFFVVGLGSMGKRRIRNLFANGEKDIVGFDIRSDRNQEAKEKYNIKVVDNFDDVNPDNFDALIISTSPEVHGDYIRFALKNKKHFFVEHPINSDGYEDIFKNKDLDIVKAPSCTHIHSPAFQKTKEILDSGKIGKILAYNHHMGQYLPDWHPWEDYRDVYFSKKETSACKEMLPFELIGINWLIGSKVKEVFGSIEKVSDLDMNADDLLVGNLKYDNGVRGTTMIDVLSRKPILILRFIGTKGTLEWSRYDLTVKLFDIESGKTQIIDLPSGHVEDGYVNSEEPYNEEIKSFIGAIRKENEYPHTFSINIQLLETLYALEESSRAGKVIEVKKT